MSTSSQSELIDIKTDKLLSSTQPSSEKKSLNKTNSIDDNSSEGSTASRDSAISVWYSPIKEGSLRGAILSVIAGTFGAGCLTFPYAFSRVGLIPGISLLLFISLSMGLMLKLLVKAGIKSKIFNFSNFALETLGPIWNNVYNVCSILLLVGAIMNYMLTSYEMIEQFSLQIFGFDLQPYRIALFAGGCFLIQIPLSLFRDMSKLQYASLIASAMIFIVIIIIVVEAPFYFIQNGAKGLTIPMFKSLSWDYLDATAIIMYGYMNHNAILQIISEIKKPTLSRGNKVINRSWIVNFLFYLFISLGGFISTLDQTPPIFIKRQDLESFSPDYAIIASRAVIAICLFSLIPLRWNLMREAIASLCKVEKMPPKKDIILTIVCMISFNVIVYFVNIITIIGFIGGIVTVMISFIIPLFGYQYVFRKKKMSFILILGYILFGIFLVIGTGATVKSVVDFL